VTELRAQERSPKIIALENVIGTLHSHNGKDFASICNELHQAGYKFGAIVVDAVLFVPQSRPRLFIIGIRKDLSWPKNLFRKGPSLVWHSRALLSAYEKLPEDTSQSWVWWEMPPPPRRNVGFSELVEHNPTGVRWHSPAETQRILDLMSGVNLAKIEAAKCASLSSGRQLVGGIYRRTRLDENGFKVQRAEVRFDDVAGCLRTPAGGSSRQLIAVVDGKSVRTRLISSRETARLMGLPDHYILPDNYNEAYHLTGDGVVVPVVRYIAENIFEPLLSDESLIEAEAA
jgi:DNA (cytosine-5)-methyltransferase 1